MFSWKIGILLLSFLFLAPILASSKTWVVDDDGGPGVDFTDIQPAIDAAAPGDLIVVRNGHYNGFTLTKNLTLTADTGHRPDVKSHSTVTGIDTKVVISGFDTERLFMNQSLGIIMVDDCTCAPAMMIEQCALVMLSRCRVAFLNSGTGGPPAVQAMESKVILSECTIRGMDGLDGGDLDPAYDGGVGLAGSKSTLYIQATSCEGGQGGDYWGDYYFAGNGGDGIQISDSTLHLFGLASHVVSGGKGGTCEVWPYFGDPGDGIEALSSTIAYSGIYLSSINNLYQTCEITKVQPHVPVITLEGTGQFGDYIEVLLDGWQGSTYTLFVSTLPGAHPLEGMYTHLLLNPWSFHFLTGGTLPASHLFPIPPQATGYRGLPVIFQAYVSRPIGPPFISTSAAFVLR